MPDFDPSSLTQDQLVDARAAFNLFDNENKGYLTPKDFIDIISLMIKHATESEINAMFRVVDTNGNGRIEFEEYLAWVGPLLPKVRTVEELRETFKVFDQDGDGQITPVELRNVMIQMGEQFTDEDIANMICRADTNGDGRVDFHEFMAIMRDDEE